MVRRTPDKDKTERVSEDVSECEIGSDGVINIAPCAMEKDKYDTTDVTCTVSDKYSTCAQCRKEYWLAEVE